MVMEIEAIRAGKLKQLAGADLEDEDLSGCKLERINLAMVQDLTALIWWALIWLLLTYGQISWALI
jgi:hypothetical protein